MADFQTSVYSPQNVNVYIDSMLTDNYAAGNSIEITVPRELYNYLEGSHGDATFVKIVTKCKMLKLRLKQVSTMHLYLTGRVAAETITAAGLPASSVIEVKQGSTLVLTASMRINKPANRPFPASESGTDEPVCEWTLIGGGILTS